MVVKETHENKGYEDNTTRIVIEVKTDEGKTFKISIGEGEKEDMTLSRDLNSAFFIGSAILEAYECGKEGKS